MRALLVGTAIVSCVAAGHGAWAYPIPPRTLWQLVEDAELIVLAEVDRVSRPGRLRNLVTRSCFQVEATVPIDLGCWDLEPPGATAHLRIVEIWKGQSPARLSVDFAPGMICPAPPRYDAGRQVLAFLEQHQGRWTTVALSYGTRYPDESELDHYRRLVAAARSLQTRPASQAERIEWHVQAASRAATRWDGLSGPMPADARGFDIGALLSREQAMRIAEGFLAEPESDFMLPSLLQVVATVEHPELDKAVVAAVERLLRQQETPWWAPEAIVELWRRFGDPSPAARVHGLKDALDKGDREQALRLWDEARAELGFPAVEPGRRPQGTAVAVGTEAPD